MLFKLVVKLKLGVPNKAPSWLKKVAVKSVLAIPLGSASGKALPDKYCSTAPSVFNAGVSPCNFKDGK